MTVQRSQGNVVIDPDDFQRTDNGINWAIKCRAAGGTEFVFVVSKQSNGSWTTEVILDDAFDLHKIKYTDMNTWLMEVIVPKLNAWLQTRFGVAAAPPPSTDPLDVACNLINTKLHVARNSAGFLQASVS